MAGVLTASPRQAPPTHVETKMPPKTTQPKTLPFTAPDADIILRTADNVDFRVHRKALASWSSHLNWETILHHHHHYDKSSWLNRSDVPIVEVDEDATTIHFLLQHVYPMVKKQTLDISDGLKVLKAARKYMIHSAIKDAKKIVAEFAARYPLHAYESAVQERMEPEMRMAAAAALALPRGYVQDSLAVPEHLSPDAYSRLLTYYRRCVRAAIKPLDDLGWMVDIAKKEGWVPVWATCTNPACPKSRGTTAWYWRYFHTVRSALSRAPCHRTLRNPTLAAETLHAARACSTCAGSVREDLNRFNKLLEERVARDVAFVSPPAIFCVRKVTLIERYRSNLRLGGESASADPGEDSPEFLLL